MAKTDSDTTARDSAWIRELASILDETGLTEIEIEKEDIRLRVSRGATAVQAAAAPYAAPAAAPAAPVAPLASAAAQPATEDPAANAAPAAGAVTSPMVGTVYLAPSPDADAFVKTGDQVKEGQTLMIIEAMKTMNPVTAPRAGTVSRILVRNEQPVEFGEALVVVD